jgi:glucosamine 6-phosphate synthetase-like amidotransferase/phosphosugar isomerase protein
MKKFVFIIFLCAANALNAQTTIDSVKIILENTRVFLRLNNDEAIKSMLVSSNWAAFTMSNINYRNNVKKEILEVHRILSTMLNTSVSLDNENFKKIYPLLIYFSEELTSLYIGDGMSYRERRTKIFELSQKFKPISESLFKMLGN